MKHSGNFNQIDTHIPTDYSFFFFNDTAPTEIYTLSLHDALPISWTKPSRSSTSCARWRRRSCLPSSRSSILRIARRSEEHTSELQSPDHLVCRLLLEKKKQNSNGLKIV